MSEIIEAEYELVDEAGNIIKKAKKPKQPEEPEESSSDAGGCCCCGGCVVFIMGMPAAAILSWNVNGSVLWAIIHGMLNWLYVIYYFFVY